MSQLSQLSAELHAPAAAEHVIAQDDLPSFELLTSESANRQEAASRQQLKELAPRNPGTRLPAALAQQIKPASYFRVKPLVDRVVTAMLLVIALPLMVLVGLAILLLDGRPIFFRQTRLGKHGRPYRVWKFRTMCTNAERGSGAVWSSDSDPRVTALGRWLRCSHLDELPQLFNVLTGDMNLIGPRPERPEFVRELVAELPFYEQRLTARPGITGLAQLRLGYDQSLAHVHDKVVLDLAYIQSTSFVRDMALLAQTLPHVIRKLTHKWCQDRRSSATTQSGAVKPAVGNCGISPTDLSKYADSTDAPLKPHLTGPWTTVVQAGSPPGLSRVEGLSQAAEV